MNARRALPYQADHLKNHKDEVTITLLTNRLSWKILFIIFLDTPTLTKLKVNWTKIYGVI